MNEEIKSCVNCARRSGCRPWGETLEAMRETETTLGEVDGLLDVAMSVAKMCRRYEREAG